MGLEVSVHDHLAVAFLAWNGTESDGQNHIVAYGRDRR